MSKLKNTALALALTLVLTGAPQISHGATFGSVTHIHSVKVFGNKILMGTHEGLYLYQAANSMKKLGSEDFDVMGLAISGQIIYSSGHPGATSKLPNPIGLLESTDAGKSWKKISLQGKVDFHMLEVGKNDIYGVDSSNEQLMYSSDRGKNWRKLGKNQYSDIAVLSAKSASAYGLLLGSLVRTTDAFATSTAIKSSLKWSSVEIVGSTLYASSGKAIYRSADSGKNWKKIATLAGEISGISINKEIIVAIANDTIFISSDGGKSFKS